MKKLKLESKLIEELEKFPNISVTAEKVHLSRQTIYRWMKEDYNFKIKVEEAIEMGYNSLIDLAESKLITNVNSGDQRAIEFLLKHLSHRYRNKKPDVSDEVKFIPITNIYHDSLDEKSNKKVDDIEL